MKIIFMGTPEFAVASLDALLKAGHDVCAVVTVADKPAGRGQTLQQSAVKQFAVQHQLPVLQPINLKDPGFLAELKNFGAHLQFVVAFRMLPEQVWNMPPLGTYNLHASLLPRYRGAAPINHAVINGDHFSGITTFKLQHQIDTGSILLQEKVEIGEDMTAGELHDVLMLRGAQLIVESANLIAQHQKTGQALTFSVQDETQVSHAPKIFREHCKIDWQHSAVSVYNHIRGLSPYPAAYTELSVDGAAAKTLKIYKARRAPEVNASAEPCTMRLEEGRLFVCSGDGWLELQELQLEGKKRMPAAEFIKGQRDLNKLRLR
jgi:methionyl-tRNA formyltransferase